MTRVYTFVIFLPKLSSFIIGLNTVCGGLFKHSFKTNIPLRLETRGSQEPV